MLIGGIGDLHSRKISENLNSLHKRDAVLAQIRFGFRGIPFELQTHILPHLQFHL